ncbi:DUF2974 domain-containing protein [Paenibacillus athensensis]|uniref:Fungal lipase-like domain-containing protein n=1 Tax=Paenibacillus athensensis TaxID=1967502 RepID=A0A4Y8Q702_9BACL|nr:Mbeg1-like protein [Paenibacillus athensensis]MCD1257394.1 DUF2974 domain-containing protein [Paenibacillus athensensis]
MQVTELDAWVLSKLAYLDVFQGSRLYKNYTEGNLTVGDLTSYYKTKPEEMEQLKDRFASEGQFEEFQRVITEISDPGSRYFNWKVSRMQDNNATTGFVAYTFEPEPGEAVVAFRGSEDMAKLEYRNDWQNNASSVYARQTVQQKDAEAYMADPAMKEYGSITITGHSLGGNLALYATLTADPHIRDAIASTQTFNAPGFNKEFIQAHQAVTEAMRGRIQEFQNKYDLVSSIMYNPTIPIIIDTTAKDKKAQNIKDNHALDFLQIENGRFKRSDHQEKDIGCQVVSDFTQRLQTLPAPMLEGMVDAIFAIWNGRIDHVDIAAAGLTLAGFVFFGPEMIALVADVLVWAIVPELVKFVVVPALQNAYQFAQQSAIELYEHAKVFVEGAIAAASRSVVVLRHTLQQFKEKALQQVEHTVKGLINGIKSLWGSSKAVYAEEALDASISDLRTIGERLSRLQQRLGWIDDRMNTLRKLVDWEDKGSVILLDLRIGYDSDLRRCQDYVNDAADRLEQCERSIVQQAYAF